MNAQVTGPAEGRTSKSKISQGFERAVIQALRTHNRSNSPQEAGVEEVVTRLRKQKLEQEAATKAKAEAERTARVAGVCSGRKWVIQKASYTQLLKLEHAFSGDVWSLMRVLDVAEQEIEAQRGEHEEHWVLGFREGAKLCWSELKSKL